MALRLYNTLTKSKEEFVPFEKGKVKFYVCGPTVYNYIHIGNARAFIVFDVIRRFLEFSGYDVTYVMNVTDIDDKIINKAKEEGIDSEQVAKKYSEAFFEDIKGLGIKLADIYPKATENVKEIVDMIQKLVDTDIAYEVEGDVFYDVSKFADYGKLSGKNIDELISGARVSINAKKRNPLDFALWKKQKSGEPSWESPWGDGRPGWHIECSTMAMKHLGNSFDIHAGGMDLIFPHHENEIAQSENATNQKFVKYWLHNGFLNIDGEKMAKSLGNFRTVREVLKTYSGDVIRLFFLQKHYRGPIDLTQEGLDAAQSAAVRLGNFYTNLNTATSDLQEGDELEKDSLSDEETVFFETLQKLKSEWIAAMEDDFNTPIALAKLFDMVREANKLLSKDNMSRNEKLLLHQAKKYFEEIDYFMGLSFQTDADGDSETINDLVRLLIDVRNDLRAEKNWQLADKIRDELNEMGIQLEDKSSKTGWKFK